MEETLIELNLPASHASIDAAATALGRLIPAAMRCLYRRHDGFQNLAVPDDGRPSLALNVFACAQADVRTRWLLDPTDLEDFTRLVDSPDPPIVTENIAFQEEIGDEVDDPRVADLVEHYLCIATEWEGSVGDFYLLDSRSDGEVVTCVPKPRVMSRAGFLAAVASPRRLGLVDFLAEQGAPRWLVDRGLCDEETVLMFHSRSRDAAPGRGTGESLGPGAAVFARLTTIPDWRRALSNFATSPFELDGFRWATVEHCFQANKFVAVAPEHYRQFALDSGSALAKGTGVDARRAGGRHGHPLSAVERLGWEARKFEVMQRALLAKYEQNPEYRNVLLATANATLTHKPARARYAQVEYGLMSVRALLR